MKARQLLILVVEPERTLSNLFQLDLARRGHTVKIVHSAEQALEVLTLEYDVVVMNLLLPEMTGEQFIHSVRAQAGYVDLPMLVVTTDATLPDSVTGSATQLRRKPFDLGHFVAYVTEAAGPVNYRN